jgi:primary-amine oxidase
MLATQHSNVTLSATGRPGLSNGGPPPNSHPLGPLTAREITQSADLIRGCWPRSIQCHFKVVTLLEPPKVELAPYLAAERAGQRPNEINRRAFVVYHFRGTVSNEKTVPTEISAVLTCR